MGNTKPKYRSTKTKQMYRERGIRLLQYNTLHKNKTNDNCELKSGNRNITTNKPEEPMKTFNASVDMEQPPTSTGHLLATPIAPVNCQEQDPLQLLQPKDENKQQMPLKPAEKMINDPEKYELDKKKDLQRMKIRLKFKKVAEMSESEKVATRKIWRELKRAHKEKKKLEASKTKGLNSEAGPKNINGIRIKAKNLTGRFNASVDIKQPSTSAGQLLTPSPVECYQQDPLQVQQPRKQDKEQMSEEEKLKVVRVYHDILKAESLNRILQVTATTTKGSVPYQTATKCKISLIELCNILDSFKNGIIGTKVDEDLAKLRSHLNNKLTPKRKQVSSKELSPEVEVQVAIRNSWSEDPSNDGKPNAIQSVTDKTQEREKTIESQNTNPTTETINPEYDSYYIQNLPDADEKVLVEHIGHRCNMCQQSICGFRYTCLQCAEYDLCQECETVRVHPEHVMIRLPAPKPQFDIESVLLKTREILMQDTSEIKEEQVETNTEMDTMIYPVGLEANTLTNCETDMLIVPDASVYGSRLANCEDHGSFGEQHNISVSPSVDGSMAKEERLDSSSEMATRDSENEFLVFTHSVNSCNATSHRVVSNYKIKLEPETFETGRNEMLIDDSRTDGNHNTSSQHGAIVYLKGPKRRTEVYTTIQTQDLRTQKRIDNETNGAINCNTAKETPILLSLLSN